MCVAGGRVVLTGGGWYGGLRYRGGQARYLGQGEGQKEGEWPPAPGHLH